MSVRNKYVLAVLLTPLALYALSYLFFSRIGMSDSLGDVKGNRVWRSRD